MTSVSQFLTGCSEAASITAAHPDASPGLLGSRPTPAAIGCNWATEAVLGWLGLCSLQCDLHSHPSQSCNAAATAQRLGGPPPCPLPRDAHTCPNTHRAQVRQEGNADDRQARHPRHLGPFPGGLQGEENKEWEGRTSLQNSLRSLLKVPSLPCLIFVTKLQVSTDSRLYLGIDKRIRRLGKACHQNSQD